MYQSTDNVDPLIGATLEVIIRTGLSGCTSREIAALAGLSAATINRRYGSQSQLVSQALEVGVDLEIQRLQTMTDEINDLTVKVDSAVQYLLALLQRTSLCTPSATIFRWNVFGYEREEEISSPLRQRLDDAMSQLWLSAAYSLQLKETEATLFRMIFERLGRGLQITNTPTLYLGWVQDLCGRLIDRLFGRTPQENGDSQWRQAIARQTSELPETPSSQNATKSAIIATTAELLKHNGPFDITHRRIAEHSGLSLSSITHHFATMDDILYKGCLHLIGETVQRDAPSENAIRSTTIPALGEQHANTLDGVGMQIVRALNQLELAALYRPGFRTLSNQLLLRNGSSSLQLLSNLTDVDCQIDMQDAVLWHHAVMGLMENIQMMPKRTQKHYIKQHTISFASALFL